MSSTPDSLTNRCGLSNESNNLSGRQSMYNGMKDDETLNSSKCQEELLSIHKLPLYERQRQKSDNGQTLNTKLKRNDAEKESLNTPSDTHRSSMTHRDKISTDRTTTSTITRTDLDCKEGFDPQCNLTFDQDTAEQTTYTKDFGYKEAPTMIALRPKSTRHAFAAPTYTSLSTPNTYRSNTCLEIVKSIDGPHQSVYSSDFIGCWTPQPMASIRTATSSGTRANKPHPRKDFLTYRNDESYLSSFSKLNSSNSTVCESPTPSNDKKHFSPHRHTETDLIQTLVYNRSKIGQHLTTEQEDFLNRLRLQSTYQKDFRGLSYPYCQAYQKEEQAEGNSNANILSPSLTPSNYSQFKLRTPIHPLSITHLHFNKPTWKFRNNTSTQEDGEEFVNGVLRLTVPCTRYGSNVNRNRVAKGTSE
uniref:Uncharacterized protein n=1 Tax=Trichobilharzia regenti TaxID=157069 RepID=A0AA85J1D7_TRIRE|nr:unnamed protein product [Trichobilharzia regenti]